ncbi:hypothetical protein A45J_0412 [hot springs metagenome]|uniref:DNA adenine methylase n=1 Tax=hot springs metagenome TaxID=433727 RepID=A0A5J4KTW3_9ZZZZ
MESLDAARDRLKNVYIENLSFDRLINNYDRKGTLFYCDPPYMVCLEKPGGKHYYQYTFTEADHVRLKDILSNIRGRFILSYDDHPEVRKLYRKFNIKETDPVLYSINNRGGVPARKRRELIVTNF